MDESLEIHYENVAKLKGSSPSDDLFYVLIMFDISNKKKYDFITKVLHGFCNRIQYSVYEAYLNGLKIRKLMYELERIMRAEKYFNPKDRIRVYRVSANCELTVFGEYIENIPERNVFI